MAELLRMPEVAANATEAVLLSWPVAENVRYAVADTIATVETDKAIVDVEAERDGVILRTLVAAGSEVAVGAAIALIAGPDEQIADIDTELIRLGAVPEVRASIELEVPEVAQDRAVSASTDVGSAGQLAAAGPSPGRVFASPLARRMAREAGLGLADITGTGPNDRIVRRDVTVAIGRLPAPLGPDPAAQLAAEAPAPPRGAEAPTQAPAVIAPYTDIPHSRLRAMIASRLVDSKRQAPHFYLRGSATVDELIAVREELNEGSTTRVSINDLVVKAVAAAHLAVPSVNAIWQDEFTRQFSAVDLAVAIATEGGIVTPVLRSVHSMSITAIARTTADYAARARSGRLHQHELDGGSATVTNLGMFGVEEFAAIINPPQSLILAVGAARQEPVVIAGEVRVATVMRVTASLDHRVIDGAVAARWLAALINALEHPVRLLG